MDRLSLALILGAIPLTLASPVAAQPVSFTVSSPEVVAQATDAAGTATTTLSAFSTAVTVDYETPFALDMGVYRVAFGLSPGTVAGLSRTHESHLTIPRPLTIETSAGTFTGTSSLTSNVRYSVAGFSVRFFASPVIFSDIYDLGSVGSLQFEADPLGGPSPFTVTNPMPLSVRATLHRPSPSSIPEPGTLALLVPGALLGGLCRRRSLKRGSVLFCGEADRGDR